MVPWKNADFFGTLFLTCQSDQEQLYVNEKPDCKSERNIENMEYNNHKIKEKKLFNLKKY